MWSKFWTVLTLAVTSSAQAVEPTTVFPRIPGIVTRLTFDDTRTGHMVVNGEWLITTDGGVSWTKSATPRVVQPIWMSTLRQPGWKGWAVAPARSYSDRQFWQIDEKHGLELVDTDLFTTSDSGATWKAGAYPGASLGKPTLYFKGSRGLIITTPGDIRVSDDYGVTWNKAAIDPVSKSDLGKPPDQPFVMLTTWYGYATRGGNTIYETRDGGRNWQPFFTGNNEYFHVITCYASDCWAAASEGRLVHWNAAAALH
ncbi:hypothetical protein F183_A35990 [Bryobacterales bacterium F-183]|nr:hypothetical protein F183_A35990 [Bryobacterales bacterium F-183]